jgi:hypothetical protein
MTYQFWRLSDVGPDNLGLACTNDGLLLGQTPLILTSPIKFCA